MNNKKLTKKTRIFIVLSVVWLICSVWICYYGGNFYSDSWDFTNAFGHALSLLGIIDHEYGGRFGPPTCFHYIDYLYVGILPLVVFWGIVWIRDGKSG